MHANTTSTINALGTGASVQVLPESQVRAWLFIQNADPDDIMYLNFGAAAGLGTGIKLGPGSAAEFSAAVFMPQGTVNVLALTGKRYTVIYA